MASPEVAALAAQLPPGEETPVKDDQPDHVICWPDADNPNAERCRVRDELGMCSEFDAEPRG